MVENRGRVPWSIADTVKASLVFLVLLVLGYGLRLAATGTFVDQLNPRLLNFTGFFLIYGLLALIVWLFTVKKYQVTADAVGLGPFGLKSALAAGFWWLVVIKVGTVAYAAAAQAFGFEAPSEIAENVRLLFGPGIFGLILAVLVTAGLVPFVEEFFFRGFVYPAFRNRFGIAGGIAMSAAIFAIFHPD
ncbi:MAG: lysostaphin resistance A-like protein, partial [Terriglobia bacterium]